MSETDINQTKLPAGVSIRHELKPGDIGYLTYLHGTLYAMDCGWDHTFEAYVAGPLSEFAKSHTDREQIWLVEKEGALVGSIAIVQAAQDTAQLRWLLLHPDLRGLGLGRTLLEDAMSFCRKNGYHAMYLWTESKLSAADKLYGANGFQLAQEKTRELWGTVVTEQRYELQLA
jgi:GNAT superfamily N-acetyltransferase